MDLNHKINMQYGCYDMKEEIRFKSIAAQEDFVYQTEKPIIIECNINEEFFGEEKTPTPDLWTPLCGCKDCD